VSSLETEIQVCSADVATCESNLTKEKDFAAFQKEKNQKLKKMMTDTRKNNQILMSQCDNSKNIIYQNEILKKQNEELKIKLQKLEEERNAETNKRIQCQSENISYRELILELKTSQSKLTSDLEICESADSDLLISDQELVECNEELETEMKKSHQCESEKKICQEEIISYAKEVESGSAEHIITKQELQACEEELEDEIQKTNNLQTQNSKLLKPLEKSRSSSATNQKLAQECQEQLEDEIEGKEILQKKYESVCPSWSEWSNCSQTCWGIKTRTDRCSNSDEQIKGCNQFSSCSRSGK